MKYLICGIPCIEVCMESDHKKSFFYLGRYFVKMADYYGDDDDVAAIPPQNSDPEQKGQTKKEIPPMCPWAGFPFIYANLSGMNGCNII